MKRKKLFTRVASLLLLVSVSVQAFYLPSLADTITTIETQKVTFSGTTQNQNQTVTIPNLGSVTGATVDNGNVGYSANGNQVTVNVSGGNASTRPVTYSESY